jgi:GxxExxY protein
MELAMILQHSELTARIIGAAIEVHRALGPGFVESIYERALCVELRRRGVRYRRQCPFSVCYRDEEVGLHQVDLLVEDTLVVDLKAVRRIASLEFARVRSQLRATGKPLALILNFGKPTLEIKRVEPSWERE